MANYIGNDDFRGYLAYLGQQGDERAGLSLNYVGNDGGINDGALREYNQVAPGDSRTDDQYQQQARDYVTNAYSQWSAGRGNVLGASTNGDYGAYSGNIAQLDASDRRLRDLLGQSDVSLNQGLSQLGTSYQQQQNKAMGDRTRTLEDFGMKREETTAGKDAALGRVDTNARTLNDSLRRILGLASGSGSSAFQLAAPNAVSRQASQSRQGVLGDFASNFRQLDVGERRAGEDYQSLLDDLLNQRNQREYDLRTGVESQKQGIISQLGDIASQRKALQGGGTAAQIAAANPYQDQYNTKQAEINALFQRFQPSVQAKTVNPQQVALNPYTVDRAAINANQQMGNDAYSPYSQFLKRQREQQGL